MANFHGPISWSMVYTGPSQKQVQSQKNPKKLGVEWRVVLAFSSRNQGLQLAPPNDLITCFIGLSFVLSLSQFVYEFFYCRILFGLSSDHSVGTQMESTLLC